MISFACKQVEFKELLMCSFGLTKREYRIIITMLKGKEYSIKQLAGAAGVDRSTVQKAIKGLLDKQLVSRRQVNQENGGYLFLYKPKDKQLLKQRMESLIDNWSYAVKEAIKAW